jgi:hypothetical protein
MEPTARLAEALDRITALERSICVAQAEQVEWVHELRVLMREVETHPSRSDRENREWADRSCTAELATALRVHERTASRILGESTALAVDLRGAHAALAAGDISLQHVRDLIDAAAVVPADRVAEFEQEAIGKACRMTPVGFRKALHRMRHRYDPVPLEVRKGRAVEERRLVVEPVDDGMAWVNLFCAAEHATAIAARVRAITGTHAVGDARTMAQREADCAVALLIGLADGMAVPESGDLGVVRATVNIMVPALTCSVTVTSRQSSTGTGRSTTRPRVDSLRTRRHSGRSSPIRSPAQCCATGARHVVSPPTWRDGSGSATGTAGSQGARSVRPGAISTTRDRGSTTDAATTTIPPTYVANTIG